MKQAITGAVIIIAIMVLAVVFNGGGATLGTGTESAASSANASNNLIASAQTASTAFASSVQGSGTPTAGSVPPAVVSGVVLGESGNSTMYPIPIRGAVVTLTNAANSTIIATAVSDSNGDYSLSIPSPNGQPLVPQPYIIRVQQGDWNNGAPASVLIYLFWNYGNSSNFKNNLYLTNPNSAAVSAERLSIIEANVTVVGPAAELPCEALRLPCPLPTSESTVSATLIMYSGTYYYVSYVKVNDVRYTVWYGNSTYYCVTPQVGWATVCPAG